MGYKRIHVRVPISGDAVLSNNDIAIQATAIDISPGGLGITDSNDDLGESEYNVVVTTSDGKIIAFTATLVRQDVDRAGFRTKDMDEDALQTILELTDEYQTTTDFVEQVAAHDLLNQQFIDDDGTELEVTFDSDEKKP